MFTGLLSKLFKTREAISRKATKHKQHKSGDEFTEYDDDYLDPEKPFIEHLDDLRTSLIKIVLTLIIVTLFCFIFNKQLLQFMKWPLHKAFSDRPDIVKLIKTIEEKNKAPTKEAETNKNLVTKTKKPTQPKDASLEQQVEFLTSRVNELETLISDNRDSILGVAKSPPGTQTIKPTAYFISTIKLCFISGIILSFPLLLYFLAEFIFPGLKNTEKKVLIPSLAIGFGLFLIGSAFCYTTVLPRVLQFFDEFSRERGVEAQWTIEYYLTFASQLVLIFGLAFELPVVVIALVKMGILNFTIMKNTFAYAVVAIFIVGAIITPTPDALTLILLSGPMILLYLISMVFACFIERKEKRLYPELYTPIEDDIDIEIVPRTDNDNREWNSSPNDD